MFKGFVKVFAFVVLVFSGFSSIGGVWAFDLILVGGKSASSSSATTGTTSVPPTRYSTPTIRSVPSSTYTTPSVFQRQQWEQTERYLRKMERKRAKRERNESLLRMLGILP
jgi:hypothetical protein